MAIVLGGGRYDGQWFEGEEALDATDLLGVYERVMGLIGYQANLNPMELSTLSPTCSAEIQLPDGRKVGALGQIHPEVPQGLRYRAALRS